MDEYCERLGPGLWAEPLNAMSNAAFVVAAMVLFVRWRRLAQPGAVGLLLILNVFAVGVGSFLYHTFANRWSVIADVLPITIFILFYLVVALRAFLRLTWRQSLAVAAAFMAGSQFVTGWLQPLIGYTAAYLPALAAILAVGLASAPRDRAIANGLLMAGLVFAVSILFRAADLPLCGRLPAGTHMIWHLLNATTLYLLVGLYLGREATAVPGAR